MEESRNGGQRGAGRGRDVREVVDIGRAEEKAERGKVGREEQGGVERWWTLEGRISKQGGARWAGRSREEQRGGGQARGERAGRDKECRSCRKG